VFRKYGFEPRDVAGVLAAPSGWRLPDRVVAEMPDHPDDQRVICDSPSEVGGEWRSLGKSPLWGMDNCRFLFIFHRFEPAAAAPVCVFSHETHIPPNMSHLSPHADSALVPR
jgi:hypothetical protein